MRKMMKKYVLTGAPGSGKSSIILGLEKRGEYVIRESAEDHIKYEQAKGVEEPWKKKNFQGEILKLQLQRENRIPEEVERVFLDRCVIDGLAYVKEGGETYEKLIKASERMDYDKIFLVELMDEVNSNSVRREGMSEAKKLQNNLIQEYEKQGYELVTVHDGSVEDRISTVLNNI